jgi:hypothetical protein
MIALVSCAAQKLDRPAPAAELYTSPLFRASRRRAEQCDHWYVLSALHGLVAPTQIIAPYDRTLADLARAGREEWGRRVATALVAELGELRDIEFLVLAGERYCEPLRQHIPRMVEPLRGMMIGRRLQFLKTC